MFISRNMSCRHHSNVILSSLRLESQHKVNIIGYVNPRSSYMKASGFTTKSNNVEPEDTENREKNQIDANEKILRTTATKRIINIIRTIDPRRRYIKISNFRSELENVESKTARDEIRVQRDDYQRILGRAIHERIRNTIGCLDAGTKYNRTSGLSHRSENPESKVPIEKRENSDQKVIETGVKQSFISQKDISAPDSSGGSESTKSEVATREKESHSYADEEVTRSTIKERIINVIGNVNSRRKNSQPLNLFDKWKEGRSGSVGDRTKIQFNVDREVLEAAVKERMTNIIGYVNARKRNMGKLSSFGKWKDEESEAVKDKTKIRFNVDREVLAASVKERMTNIIGYVNARKKNMGELSFFGKWKDEESEAVNDKKNIHSEHADQEISKATVEKRIVELNAEMLEKITGRPLDTENEEQTIKATKLKEEAKDVAGEEAATAEPLSTRNSTDCRRKKDNQGKSTNEDGNFDASSQLLRRLSTILKHSTRPIIKYSILFYFGINSTYSVEDFHNHFILAYGFNKVSQMLNWLERGHTCGTRNVARRSRFCSEYLRAEQKSSRRICYNCGKGRRVRRGN